MPGIGVITNPRSRKNRRNPELARNLAYIVGEQGELRQPDDLEMLHQVCCEFRDKGVEIVAVNGGDGTSHVVLTALWRAYEGQPLPRIALLRGGTMNTIASGLGIKGDPEDLLGRLVSSYHYRRPLRSMSRHLVIVQDEQVGFIFGNGLISNFLEAYYEGSEPSPAKAAWLLARAVGSAMVRGSFIDRIMNPMRCRVTLDGREWPDLPWTTIAASTVDDIGLRFRPFYKAPSHPGYLHAIGIGCTPLQMAWQLQRIRRALPTTHPDIHDDLCHELVIEADEQLSYMIDGDFHRTQSKRLVVRVGPPVELVAT